MARKIKVSRQARPITVQGEEVYTRYSKREYEQRQEQFDDPDWNPASHQHLSGFTYAEWTEMGSQGGRPKKWASEAERMRAKRAQRKLALGKPLTLVERKLLGLVKSRPGALRSKLGRAMTPAERKARWRAKSK